MSLRNKGFTLLEAIVALVLIGTAGMTLFSWVNQSVSSLQRIEQANDRNTAIENTIEFMQSMNPMETPEGHTDFGAYSINWKAEAITDKHDGTNQLEGQSLYQLSLYKTQITGRTETDSNWFDINLKLVGYKRVREPVIPFK